MANKTRQVQQQDSEEPIKKKWTLAELASSDLRPKVGSLRIYPGEAEGDSVAGKLNYLRHIGVKQHPFLQAFSVLQELAEAHSKRDISAVTRWRKKKRTKIAYDYLISSATESRLGDGELEVHKDGLIIKPLRREGRAALSLLLLEKNRRIDRIRECLHCHTWFYARFKHQQFCPDRAKKCQWNHYHTQEWRTKNRERNKRLQQKYRDQLFVKPSL